MDINKIRESMKVLKDECKKYKKCEDCTLNDPQNKSCVLLEKEPDKWEEDKIVENNCTTVHRDIFDEWYGPVFRCDDCDRAFVLSHSDLEAANIIGKFCPHCGKKIIDYKEKEDA